MCREVRLEARGWAIVCATVRDGSVEGAYDRLAIAVALLTEVATRSRAAKIEVVRRPHVLHGTAAEADGAAGTSWAADGVQLLKRRLRSRWVW